MEEIWDITPDLHPQSPDLKRSAVSNEEGSISSPRRHVGLDKVHGHSSASLEFDNAFDMDHRQLSSDESCAETETEPADTDADGGNCARRQITKSSQSLDGGQTLATLEDEFRSVDLTDSVQRRSNEAPSPISRPGSRTPPPESLLDNAVHSPKLFRQCDDLTMDFPFRGAIDSEGEGDAGADAAVQGHVTKSVTGEKASDGGPSEANTTGARASSEVSEAGFFGRIFQRTRDGVEALLGCAASPQRQSRVDRSNNPQNFEIDFAEVEVLELVGSGASGCVFLGHYNGEKVAVKKFADVDPTLVETRQLSRLSHPNIVAFLGVCTRPPVYCIVMEFCPRSLYKVISDTRIPPRQICEWARQIACGMHYLHSQKHMHRDLKSPNVLLAQDGKTLRISDFGTARHFSGSKSAERVSCVGSPGWMAPELIRAEPCSMMVDVWSYGVVLWELLTGEMPYKGVDQGAIIFGVGNKSLHLPVPSTAPPGFSLLLKQCWNTNPKHRPEFRQILLHLEILLDDTDFAEVPIEAYYATQLKWRKEMATEFEKMKQEELELRKADQELLRRREDELRHAQDVRQLYESRLFTVSSLLADLRERERVLLERERLRSTKRGRRSLGSASSTHKKGYAKNSAGSSRRRSKDGARMARSGSGSSGDRSPRSRSSLSSLGGDNSSLTRSHANRPHRSRSLVGGASTPTLNASGVARSRSLIEGTLDEVISKLPPRKPSTKWLNATTLSTTV